MNWKISALILAGLSAAVTACAQHSSSEPVLDVSAMDKTIDPCVDFYTYSCGGWIKKKTIPPAPARWGTYRKHQDENPPQVRASLGETGEENGAREAGA